MQYSRAATAQAATPAGPPEGRPYDNPNDPRTRGRGQEQQVPHNSFVDPPFTRRARRGIDLGFRPAVPLQSPTVINLDDSQELVPPPPPPQLPAALAPVERPDANFSKLKS